MKKGGDCAHKQLLNPRRVGFQIWDRRNDGWKWGYKGGIFSSFWNESDLPEPSLTLLFTFFMVWWFQSHGLVDVFSFGGRKKRLGKCRPS